MTRATEDHPPGAGGDPAGAGRQPADKSPPPGNATGLPLLPADVLLADGGTVHLRVITPEDANRVVALHSRFSARTRYLRYFSPYPRIPDRDLKRFITVDHLDREAVVGELGDDLVAIGRYDRLDDSEAEVAFVVEDAHQGRGLGSVLLEYLSALAAGRGIKRFLAEVLPENGQMMRVFADAGYVIGRAYDEGVVHLRFDIAPTERSVEVTRTREQRAESRSIARFLCPTTVAVVGASTRPDAIGAVLLRHLVEAGFTGTVYAVHPSASDVSGVPAFRSLADIGEHVDLAVVAVPAPAVDGVVADAAHAGVHGLVVVSGGFGECGPAGVEAERRLVEVARANGMRVVGPNCFGVLNTEPRYALNASLAPTLPAPGRTGFFCQSGALGVAILDAAARRGLGFSSVVSAGNRADVSGNDLLQYWQDDPRTDVVLMYLETFGNPRKFARVARRLARQKPVAVVKSRGMAPGLATGRQISERALQALFSSSGVIRVDTVDALLDVAVLLAAQPLPGGRGVAIVGNSSALAALAAEACVVSGLAAVQDWIVDIGPEGTADDFATALHGAAEDERVDAVVIVLVPALAVPSEDFARVVLGEAGHASVPLVATFLGSSVALSGPAPDPADPRPLAVPAYTTPEAAVQALGRAAAYAEWRRTPSGRLPDEELLGGSVDPAAAREIALRALAANPAEPARSGDPVRLGDGDAAHLLDAYGVPVLGSRLCHSLEEALDAASGYGYPVALKSTDDLLRHRLDLGGVRLDVGSVQELQAAYGSIVETAGRVLGAPGARPGTVLVQPMAPSGVGCVVDVADDETFGAIVGFGLAGVSTDLLGDRAWRAAPLTDTEARDLVRAPLAAPLLFGHRGTPLADVAAVERLLMGIGLLADQVPEIRRIRLNPVLVAPRGLAVLHAEVLVGQQPGRPDRGPRRLR
jgi:acyl-CoA synthetase (NDP forming)/GNAT superfamily N-acetyltransferase